jgi:hypothetical protein
VSNIWPAVSGEDMEVCVNSCGRNYFDETRGMRRFDERGDDSDMLGSREELK